MIEPSVLNFMKKLEKNNNRDWFTKNKESYLTQNEALKIFAANLKTEMEKIDLIESSKLYRIYRDVRFSKDKTPYRSYWMGGLKRATKQLRGGYFWKIGPNNESLVGGGFYSPNPKDLLLIRKKIAVDDKPLRKIINAKKFKTYFGELQGERVKTAPRGFEKDHPALDLIQPKQYYAHRSFSDKEVLAPDFFKEVVKTYLALRPYFNYMSDVLTTDMNGVPIYD